MKQLSRMNMPASAHESIARSRAKRQEQRLKLQAHVAAPSVDSLALSHAAASPSVANIPPSSVSE